MSETAVPDEHLTPDQATVLIESLRTELDEVRTKASSSAMKTRLANGRRIAAEEALARSEASLARVRSNVAALLAGQAVRDE